MKSGLDTNGLEGRAGTQAPEGSQAGGRKGTDRPVALVTGASSGIGLVTARALARAGYSVACVSRGEGVGAEVVERLRAETGSTGLHFLPADLARPREAVAVVDAFRERFGRLDALVNNAGAFVSKRVVTDDGLELTFALNHLSTFALTLALLPELRQAGGRVVTVSSDAALGARLQLDDPTSDRRFSGWSAYAWSKLCNQLFTAELARRLEGSGVSANAVHPGFVATSFGHVGGVVGGAMGLMQRLFGRSPERGADTVVWLASSPEVDGRTGGYYVDRRERPFAPRARDVEAQRRLWTLSEAMLERIGVQVPRDDDQMRVRSASHRAAAAP